MKSIFENMISTLILIFLVFVFSCLTLGSMQTQVARRIHTYAMNEISSSYYQVKIDGPGSLNDKIQNGVGYKNWEVTVCKIDDPVCNNSDAYYNQTVEERQTWKVKLKYNVMVGMFNINKQSEIVGYVN